VSIEDDEEAQTSPTSTAKRLRLLKPTAPPKLKKQRFWGAPRLVTVNRLRSSGTSGSTKSAGAAICGRGYATSASRTDQGDMMSMFVEGGTYRTDNSTEQGRATATESSAQRSGLITRPNARKDRSSLSPIDYVPARTG
jgi:hypothetical protein